MVLGSTDGVYKSDYRISAKLVVCWLLLLYFLSDLKLMKSLHLLLNISKFSHETVPIEFCQDDQGSQSLVLTLSKHIRGTSFLYLGHQFCGTWPIRTTLRSLLTLKMVS